MKVTAETPTDAQIDQLVREQRAPHGPIGDTWYWAKVAQSTVQSARTDARAWLARSWNVKHGDEP